MIKYKVLYHFNKHGGNMKQVMSILLVVTFGLGIVFGSTVPRHQTPVKHSTIFHPEIEPTTVVNIEEGQPSGPIHHYPVSRNDYHISLVDSSKNGYGMIVSMTRPMSVNENGLLMGYRQWAGESGTSGQIGAAFSDDDGYSWTTYQNMNPGMGIGRYPSSLGMFDYPYVFWNEYTGTGAGYGGTPYYTWDEFGWDGGSFADAQPVDLEWAGHKDLWVGSPDYSYDESTGSHWFNVAYADWTREDKFVFHSESYSDGYLIFGSEILAIDVNNDMVGGDDEGSYTSSPVLDVNDDGIGYVSVSTYFDGADVGASPYCNTHTIAFKRTDDYGATWYGGQEGTNYFFIDDNVFDHMLNNGAYADHYGPDNDECADTTITWDELFIAYDFDMRVDSQGNPHFITSVLPASDGGIWTSLTESIGWWHFWIDKNHLENPGFVNTPMGWNYSFVLGTSESFRDWDNYFPNSYWYQTFSPSLAISEESDDVMYVVTSLIEPGEFTVTDDGGTPDDGCDDWGYFLEWSFDNFVIKTVDGGDTWWCPYQFETPDPDSSDEDRPDETYAHASPDGATNNDVYLCYQMPDYPYGSTTGDVESPADWKNRIYAGKLTLDTEPSCGNSCETTVDNNAGWNLVGLPGDVEDTSYLTLFPGAISGTCYYFDAGYQQADNLTAGMGYWLRFNDASTNTVTGGCLGSLDIALNAGWNLMTVGSFETEVSTLCDPDNIVIPGTFYAFDAGYQQATTLMPGKGYWVRTNAAGTVSTCGTGLARIDANETMADANSITFNGSVLNFGVSVPEETRLSYSLPPKPPVGAFDVRFAGDWRASENGGVIEMMTAKETVSISYSISDGNEWVLESANDSYTLTGTGSMDIPASSSYILVKGGTSTTPDTYSLGQGYPNPFNPETTIDYQIANAGHVNIVVYDMLGREVKTLVNGYHTPNMYSIIWNGTTNEGKMVPSGVYFYHMTSADFSQVNKVMLLK